MIMDRLNGRIAQLPSFIHHCKFEIFSGPAPGWLKSYLMAVAFFMMATPLITIVAWTLILFSNGHSRAAISVLLLGLSAQLGLLGFMKIKWNNWRFKRAH